MTGDERSIQPVPGKVPESRKPMTSTSRPRGLRRDAAGRRSCNRQQPAATLHERPRSWGSAWPGSLLALASVAAAPASQVEKFPEGTIVKIEFEGTSIAPEKIKPKLLSRVGQPLSHEKARPT